MYDPVSDILTNWHSPAARQFYLDQLRPPEQASDLDQLKLQQGQLAYQQQREQFDRQKANPWQGMAYDQMAANPSSPAYEWVNKSSGVAAMDEPNRGIQMSLGGMPQQTGGYTQLGSAPAPLPDAPEYERRLITGPRKEAMMANTKAAAASDVTDSEASRNWRVQYQAAVDTLNRLRLPASMATPDQLKSAESEVQRLSGMNPTGKVAGAVTPPPSTTQPAVPISSMDEKALRKLDPKSLTAQQRKEAAARWNELGLK